MANSHTKSVTDMEIEEYRAHKHRKREDFLKQFPPQERPKHRAQARAIVRQDDKRRKDIGLET